MISTPTPAEADTPGGDRSPPPAGRRLSAAGATLTVATLLSGLFAGFFAAFEVSVLLGFDVVDDTTYVLMFQAVNATIRNAPFGIIFFGTVPAVMAALVACRHHGATRTVLAVALACFVAVLGITFAGNIPLNEELAVVEVVTEADAAQARADFEAPWNRLNIIRTLIAVAGFGAVAVAGQLRPGPGRA